MAMTLDTAEQILSSYRAVLEATDQKMNAHCASVLPATANEIIQAAKLILANAIQQSALTQENRSRITAPVARLSEFVPDEEAHRINAADGAATTAWRNERVAAQLAIFYEFRNFISTVEQLDADDIGYWQRVYAFVEIGENSRYRWRPGRVRVGTIWR